MKKILMMLLCTLLAAALISTLIACDNGNTPDPDNGGNTDNGGTDDEPCTKHFDLDGNLECDACGALLEPEVNEATVTVTVGADGVTFSGATVVAIDETGTEFTAVSDANGKATLVLPYGEYTVMVTEGLPENHYADMISYTAGAGSEDITLTVIDNTPDGSAEKPFTVPVESTAFNITAGTDIHFTMRSANVTLKIVGNGITLTLATGESFNASEEGEISLVLSEITDVTDSFSVVTFKISAATDTSFTASCEYPIGSYDNPHTAELDTEYSVSVAKDGTVYYKWTATADGYLQLTSADSINNISLYNLTTYAITAQTNGGKGVTLYVNEGDEVSVAVATVGVEDVNSTAFTLKLYAGTEAAAIPALSGTNELTVKAGTSVSYTAPAAGSINIEADGATVTVNGTVTEVLNGITVAAGDVITVTAPADANTDVYLTFTEADGE